MSIGRLPFLVIVAFFFCIEGSAAKGAAVCTLRQKPPLEVEITTPSNIDVVLWGYSKRSIHRTLEPGGSTQSGNSTTWDLAPVGSILADAASRQCKIWIKDRDERIYECKAPKAAKVERLESACAEAKPASSKKLKSKPIAFDVDPGEAPWHGIPVQDMLRVRLKVADLAYRKINDTGTQDISEPSYWGGDDSVDIDLASLDWAWGDWSRKTAETNGIWHGGPRGRWMFSAPGYKDEWWSWLLPRALGPTIGAGLSSEKNSGERQIDVFLKYGGFIEITDFVAFEVGRLTGIALSGDFNDRTDSATFWGFRLDGKKLAKLLVVDLWR